jgi:hypothetical protein
MDNGTARAKLARLKDAGEAVALCQRTVIDQGYKLGCLADYCHDTTVAEMMFQNSQASLASAQHELARLKADDA